MSSAPGVRTGHLPDQSARLGSTKQAEVGSVEDLVYHKMDDSAFNVGSLDHVHVYVPNRREALQWYERVLGLKPVERYQEWAVENGPQMISADAGNTMIALFKADPAATDTPTRRATIAFRVDVNGFCRFVQRLDEVCIVDDTGRRVTVHDVVDHRLAFSIYFCDPYGNRYEITTYDYEEAYERLRGQAP